jgi:excisionase family DNA binding protein
VTFRSTNRRQRSSFNAASRTTSTGTQTRPVTRLRTIDEVAELLNVSPRSVRRFIVSGALPAHRLGRLVRIADPDLAAFLAASRSL